MLFPKKRLRMTNSYQGKTTPEGWIVLDLQGMDLDGASKLYLSLAEIDQVRAGGDLQAERLRRARALFGDEEDEIEPEGSP